MHIFYILGSKKYLFLDFKTFLHHIIYVRKQNEQILQILKNQNVSQSNILPKIPVELPLTEIRGIIALEEFLSENENLRSMVSFSYNKKCT